MDPNQITVAPDPGAGLCPGAARSERFGPTKRRPRIGILVDLALSPTSGGHVRFWHNIALAAAQRDFDFDLTFHFQSAPEERKGLGAVERHSVLSESVRIITLPPVYPTSNLQFLSQNPDHTDLGPYHRTLASHLPSYDVVHTTDAYFAYTKTATRKLDPRRQSLVTSIHTDTPSYTRIYAERAFRKLLGEGRLGRIAIERWGWADLAERRMKAALARHLAACQHVWLAPADDSSRAADPAHSNRIEVLRRGIDSQTFSPDRRDRSRLNREFRLDEDDFVLVFSGRIDTGKEIMVAARAVRELLDRGRKIKLILAGLGSDAGEIRSLLGAAVRLPGFVEQRRLGWILASSDAFVFPSRIETAANAVIEARTVGLPAIVSPEVAEILIRADGFDGLIVEGQTPESWAHAIGRLASDRDFAKEMGARARSIAVDTHPTWREVLERDLIPGWTRSLPRRSRDC